MRKNYSEDTSGVTGLVDYFIISYNVVRKVLVFSVAIAGMACTLAPAAFGSVLETESPAGITFNYRPEGSQCTDDISRTNFGLSTWSTGNWVFHDSRRNGVRKKWCQNSLTACI